MGVEDDDRLQAGFDILETLEEFGKKGKKRAEIEKQRAAIEEARKAAADAEARLQALRAADSQKWDDDPSDKEAPEDPPGDDRGGGGSPLK